MPDFNAENTRMLVSAFLKLESRQQCQYFLEDLLTEKEIETLSQRLAVAGCLSQGRTFSEVGQITGASPVTIGRVNRCLRYGHGGYRSVLETEASKSVEHRGQQSPDQ